MVLSQVPSVSREPNFDHSLTEQHVVAHNFGDAKVLEGDQQEEGLAYNQPRVDVTKDLKSRFNIFLVELLSIGDILFGMVDYRVPKHVHDDFVEEAHEEGDVGPVHKDRLIAHPGLFVESCRQLTPM